VYHDRADRADRKSAIVGRRELLERFPQLSDLFDAAAAQFPVSVPRSFWRRMTGDPDGPLARQALPRASELVAHPEDSPDPVGDHACSPLPWVVHKYPDRVLLLLTKRCHMYCRYCFRRTFHDDMGEDPSELQLQAAIDYANKAGVEEVILSGGDPLAVSDRKLLGVIDQLTAPIVRIHSRAPITHPSRVTEKLATALGERETVWMTVHANHPLELSDDVDVALRRLVRAGVPLLNQSVLLAGVNDDVYVLAELSRQLVRRRVKPYYLHLTDHAEGNAEFRVGAEQATALWRALRRQVSGVALPTLVIDPEDGSGKITVIERSMGHAR